MSCWTFTALQLTPPCILYRSTAYSYRTIMFPFLLPCLRLLRQSDIAQRFSYLFHLSLFHCTVSSRHVSRALPPPFCLYTHRACLPRHHHPVIALTSLTSSSYKTPPPEPEGCQCLWAFSISVSTPFPSSGFWKTGTAPCRGPAFSSCVGSTFLKPRPLSHPARQPTRLHIRHAQRPPRSDGESATFSRTRASSPSSADH
ncbi:hypothetical protein BGY98DRAFT_735327 [Russula aff. rugulosa BPL654]|nr:hypothetical protein BGY98DRAFT_735327 [Russula aff. rugulosa BPL654]